MQLECYQVPPLDTNCYLIWNESSKEAMIVDPGDVTEEIRERIEELELKPVAILLTHGHYDHIMGIREWQEVYPDLPVYAGQAEAEVLLDPDKNLTKYRVRSGGWTYDADVYLEDGQTVSLIGQEFRFLATPGHTVGSGCYYFPAQKTLLSGDTLFRTSIGRTDLPTGSELQMAGSLRKLHTIPSETKVYTGHGYDTTIAFELAHNVYMR